MSLWVSDLIAPPERSYIDMDCKHRALEVFTSGAVSLRNIVMFLVSCSDLTQEEDTRAWLYHNPDSKVHGANMGPTWVLSAPDGPHVGPMNHAIREGTCIVAPVIATG